MPLSLEQEVNLIRNSKMGIYKVVFIETNSQLHFVMQQPNENFHGSILERFLKTNSIPFKYQPPKQNEPIRLPEPRGDSYIVKGVGMIMIVPADKEAVLGERSVHYYELPIQEPEKEAVRALLPEWTIK